MQDDLALNYYGDNPFESMKSVLKTRSKFAFRFAQEGILQCVLVILLVSFMGYLLFHCVMGLVPNTLLGRKKAEEEDEETKGKAVEDEKETKKSK